MDVEETAEDLVEQRRRSALCLNDFSLMAEIYSVLDKHLPNATTSSAMDEIRDKVLGMRHPATISDLHTRIKNSTICPGHTIVYPKGNITDPKVVFVCYTYDAKSIASLATALKDCGYSSDNVAVTFLIRCSYDHPSRIADAQDMLPYVWEEIKMWRPRIIVPLGSHCSQALFGEGFRISIEHGRQIWLDEYCFIPLYSPAPSEEASKRWSEFMDDLRAIKPLSE